MAEKAAEDLAVDAAVHAALIGALRRQQQQEEEALATAASLQASDGQAHSAAVVAGVGVARLAEVEAATQLFQQLSILVCILRGIPYEH